MIIRWPPSRTTRNQLRRPSYRVDEMFQAMAAVYRSERPICDACQLLGATVLTIPVRTLRISGNSSR